MFCVWANVKSLQLLWYIYSPKVYSFYCYSLTSVCWTFKYSHTQSLLFHTFIMYPPISVLILADIKAKQLFLKQLPTKLLWSIHLFKSHHSNGNVGSKYTTTADEKGKLLSFACLIENNQYRQRKEFQPACCSQAFQTTSVFPGFSSSKSKRQIE